LFALYVVAHGHHSPGGGFQGGVIFGTSLILLSLSQGLSSALLQVSERRALCLALLGIGLYAGTGLLCLLLGGNFLDYSQLHRILPATDPVMARSHGMLLVEIGVAFTVASTMFAIYANLATRGRLKEGL
jgi:multicomponent Na+:H+ antiporter subunit B